MWRVCGDAGRVCLVWVRAGAAVRACVRVMGGEGPQRKGHKGNVQAQDGAREWRGEGAGD